MQASDSTWRVDPSKPHQRRYWCRRLGVTAEHLHAAVQKVGNCPDAVQAHLKRSRLAGVWRRATASWYSATTT